MSPLVAWETLLAWGILERVCKIVFELFLIDKNRFLLLGACISWVVHDQYSSPFLPPSPSPDPRKKPCPSTLGQPGNHELLEAVSRMPWAGRSKERLPKAPLEKASSVAAVPPLPGPVWLRTLSSLCLLATLLRPLPSRIAPF